MEADVALGAVGVQRYLRPIEHHEQLWLVGVQPSEQAIERDEAGASTEDAVEAGPQFTAPPCRGFGAIRLEVIVEPPDQRAHAFLRGAVQIGERVEFVDQPFCMHPAQRMLADSELSSVVTDNHHITQQSVRLDAAPQRPFGGDADRVGRDLQPADAEAIKVRLPSSPVGEPCLPMCRQLVDDRPGQGTPTHILQCGLIDDVVCVPGAQQIEEVQPALACPRAEPGEIVVADLRAEPVLAGVAGAGVIHRDPGRRPKASPQHVAGLPQEPVLPSDQQAHHLSLGDAHADPPQLCHQPGNGDLALMVLRQHETTQFRPEMPDHAGRQSRHYRGPIRRDPALPPVAHHRGVQHHIMHHVGLVSLEA